MSNLNGMQPRSGSATMAGTKRLAPDASAGMMTPTNPPPPSSSLDAQSTPTSSASPSSPSQPFVCLPYHGEHKRAMSAVSFAPSSPASPFGEPSSCGGYGSSIRRAGTAAVCASASADGTVKLWDVTHAMLDRAPRVTPAPNAPNSRHVSPSATLVGHNRGVNDVSWSCTAAHIATASDDKTLRIWDAKTGDALVEFRGHTNFVFSVRWNPQSNLLVSGSFDETVKLWDVRSGDCVSTLPAHSEPVTGVDFNRDGTCVVSGSHDGLIRIWDAATGECLKTIYAEGNPPVSYVRYSPNGKFVLSGTLDGRLRLWSVAAKATGTATRDRRSQGRFGGGHHFGDGDGDGGDRHERGDDPKGGRSLHQDLLGSRQRQVLHLLGVCGVQPREAVHRFRNLAQSWVRQGNLVVFFVTQAFGLVM